MTRRGLMRFEYPVLIGLATLGMMLMVSGDRPDDALCRAGTAVAGALRRRRLPARQRPQSTEAGLKYFVLGALSSGLLLYGCLADLRLHRHHPVHDRDRRGRSQAEGVGVGLLFGLVFPLRGPRLQSCPPRPSTCGRRTSTRARRHAVTAFFATAPKAAAGVLFARVLFDALRGGRVRLAADHRVPVADEHVLGFSFAAIGQTQPQAPDGLFSFNRPHGLRDDGARRGDGGRRRLRPADLSFASTCVMNVGVFAFILTMERNGRPVAGDRGSARVVDPGAGQGRSRSRR